MESYDKEVFDDAFIVAFEGTDRVGKTTLLESVFEILCNSDYIHGSTVLRYKEPYKLKCGNDHLVDTTKNELRNRSLEFFKDRLELWSGIISRDVAKAKSSGVNPIILMDRSYVSSLVYQTLASEDFYVEQRDKFPKEYKKTLFYKIKELNETYFPKPDLLIVVAGDEKCIRQNLIDSYEISEDISSYIELLIRRYLSIQSRYALIRQFFEGRFICVESSRDRRDFEVASCQVVDEIVRRATGKFHNACNEQEFKEKQ